MSRRPADPARTTKRRSAEPRSPGDRAGKRTRPSAAATRTGAGRGGAQSRQASASMQPPVDDRRGSWGGLGGLLRGSGTVLGQLSGIDAPARALDRLAASAERAADFLDRLESEVGVERVLATIDRLDRAAGLAEDIDRSLREIEAAVVDLHQRVSVPLDRIPLMRRRRAATASDVAGEPTAASTKRRGRGRTQRGSRNA